MMKKITTFAFALLMLGTVMAQTFVSTTPSNKNVILEEFTGVNCGWCPDGHRIANELMAANPGRLWAINIHTGGYAVRYNTQWGAAIANQTGLTGYPAGTVNRHVFTGSATALNRGNWQQAAGIIMAEQSPVNVAARCTIDCATRQLTVVVEAYYTDNSTASQNYLNVVLLQDNVIGPQGGASLNPSQVVGSQYRHMHMLRDMITGQWGEAITTTTQGSFFTNTYNYNIPATITDDPVLPEDLSVVVFITESHQEILTGCEAERVLLGAQPKVNAVEEVVDQYDCAMNFKAKATVRNLSESAMTSAVLSYTIGGNTQTYNWTGNIAAGATSDITLPTITGSFTSGSNYTLQVSLTQVNGQSLTDAGSQVTLKKKSYTTEGPVAMTLVTDNYASETTLKFKKADGTVLYEWGPGTNGSSQTLHFSFDPSTAGCYVLEVYDAYADGISGQYGNGYFTLASPSGQIVRDDGAYGAMARYYLNFTNNGSGRNGATNGIDDIENGNVAVYPNPVEDVLNVNAEGLRTVEVMDVNGRIVLVGSDAQMNMSALSSGMYMVRVISDRGVTVKKIVKK